MSFEIILEWFTQYAYQPHLVYGGIILFMFASSFGLPIPEELVLISAGLVAYISLHPSVYPPPFDGAPTVNPYILAGVCFLAVFLSDFIIFQLGRKFGRPLLKSEKLSRFLKPKKVAKVEKWLQKYGAWTSGFFRFTPGLRFPGHLSCGALGLNPIKFVLVDGTAALISVPTQILLISIYGETIIKYLKRFQHGIFIVLLLAVSVFIFKMFFMNKKIP